MKKKNKNKVWEFFRPTKMKLIYFLVLLVFLTIFFSFEKFELCHGCVQKEPPLIQLFFSPLMSFFGTIIDGKLTLIPFLLFQILFWYTLNCSYVLLKDKISKKYGSLFKLNRAKIILLITLSMVSFILLILEYGFFMGEGRFSFIFVFNFFPSFIADVLFSSPIVIHSLALLLGYILQIILFYIIINVVCYVYVKKKRAKLFLFLFILLISIPCYVHGITDNNLSNNNMIETVDVVDTIGLDLTFIGIDDISDCNYLSAVEDAIDFINATYPVAGEEISYDYEWTYTTDPSDSITDILNDIDKSVRISSGVDRTVGILPDGWFSDRGYGDVTGYASLIPLPFTSIVVGADSAILAEARGRGGIIAHEIGHTLYLCDEYDHGNWSLMNNLSFFSCPNGDRNDDGQLDMECIPRGCPVNNTFGRLIYWNESEGFVDSNNFMGDSANLQNSVWISNGSYTHLLSKFQMNSRASSATIMATGIINRVLGTVEIFSAYELGSRTVLERNDSSLGNYTIETFDENNNSLFFMNFTPSFLELYANGSVTETNESYFLFVVNNTINTSRIEIKEHGVFRDTVTRSANAPTVNITYPTGGEILDSSSYNITWDGADIDNNTLEYAILISDDNGANYSTLEIDYNRTYYEIDPNDFEFNDEYRVKVLVTDSMNTGNDTSGTFTTGVDSLPPSITNYTPSNNSDIRTTTPDISLEYSDSGRGINTSSIIFTFDGVDVTSNCTINETDLLYNLPSPLEFVQHNATLQIKDNASNGVNSSWIFTLTKYRLTFKNSSGDITATFDDYGNVWLNGDLVIHNASPRSANDEFILNFNNRDVAIIDLETGDMYIDGAVYENQTSLTPDEDDDNLVVKDPDGNVMIYIDEYGNMFTYGSINASSKYGSNSYIFFKDSSGKKVAHILNYNGSFVLNSTLEENSTHTRSANDEVVVSFNGEDVFILDQTNGTLYIDGELHENQASLSPTGDNFVINDYFGNTVAYVNATGHLFVKGAVTENGSP